jgi:DNA-binding HxlR family transcriptional regulator
LVTQQGTPWDSRLVRYEDPCGIARALDAVGDRWALLVVRELVLGPKRFTDLQAGLRRVSPDVLAQRLRDLEAAGVIARATLPPPAASRVYELTDRGRELEPVLHALGRWGSRTPLPEAGPRLGVDAAMVALPTLFSADRAGDLAAIFDLRLDGEPFTAVVQDGRLLVDRGAAAAPDAVIATTPGALAAVLWHDRSLRDAIAAGDATVEGSRRAAERFAGLFPLPG